MMKILFKSQNRWIKFTYFWWSAQKTRNPSSWENAMYWNHATKVKYFIGIILRISPHKRGCSCALIAIVWFIANDLIFHSWLQAIFLLMRCFWIFLHKNISSFNNNKIQYDSPKNKILKTNEFFPLHFATDFSSLCHECQSTKLLSHLNFKMQEN